MAAGSQCVCKWSPCSLWFWRQLAALLLMLHKAWCLHSQTTLGQAVWGQCIQGRCICAFSLLSFILVCSICFLFPPPKKNFICCSEKHPFHLSFQLCIFSLVCHMVWAWDGYLLPLSLYLCPSAFCNTEYWLCFQRCEWTTVVSSVV